VLAQPDGSKSNDGGCRDDPALTAAVRVNDRQVLPTRKKKP